MIEVEVEVTIQRTPEDVFGFVSDMTNDPQWHIDVIDAQPSPNISNGAARSYLLVFKYPRDEAPQSAKAEIRMLENNRKLQVQADAGPLRQVMSYTFEPLDSGGTRVIRHLKLEHDEVPKEMEPEMTPNVKARNAMYLAKLKATLESCHCGGDALYLHSFRVHHSDAPAVIEVQNTEPIRIPSNRLSLLRPWRFFEAPTFAMSTVARSAPGTFAKRECLGA